MSNLGKLEQVKELRNVWADEARHFTPWLAEEKNLALIGETLNFGSDWLELIETEAKVGRFSADIVCRDTGRDEHIIVIENQFGSSDHDHLGKLLTYAAGRKAKTVIWIAETIRDEHRAAIDLLNEATDDEYQFFALEIELWKIGDSPVAPRFNIIAKPNDWSRNITKSVRRAVDENLTELKRTYIDYWTTFKEYLGDHSQLRCQKPSPQQWMHLPIGRSNFTLTASLNTQESWIQACLEFHGDNGTKFFKVMKQQQSQIDAESEFDLTWDELPSRKGARILIKKAGTIPTNREGWEAQNKWLVEKLNHLYVLFHQRVKELELPDDSEENINGTIE